MLTCTILSIPRALSSSASSLSSVPLRKETSCSNRAFSSLRPSGVVGGPSTSSSVQGTHCLLAQRNTTSYGTGTHYQINVTGLDQLFLLMGFLLQFLHRIQCRSNSCKIPYFFVRKINVPSWETLKLLCRIGTLKSSTNLWKTQKY